MIIRQENFKYRNIPWLLFLICSLANYPSPTLTHVNDCCLRDEQIKCSPLGLKTFYLPRSQGSNNARRLAGWQGYAPVNLENAFGNVSLTLEYTRSFDNDHIAQYFFGNTCLNFQGSEVIPSNACSIPGYVIADNFGLPTNFIGKICFKPRIQNIIVDFNYFLSLDFWCKGLYWRFFAPFVVTYWNLGINCCEHNNTDSIDQTFLPCYMGTNQIQSLSSIKEALAGEHTFGDMNSPFDFGKIPFTQQKKIGIADLDLILGWNALMSETYRFAVFLMTTIPGGNRPDSKIFFEPVVGAGKSWALGGGFEGYLNFLETDTQSFGFYYFVTINHYFKTFQVRSFDFIENGPLSRYMLLKELKEDDSYNGNLLNSIDYATKAVRAGSVFNIDAAFKFSYFICNWGFDFGYNIWRKSEERLNIVPRVFPSDLLHRKFGIKQTEGVCYRTLDTTTDQIVGGGPLNSTQSFATISTIDDTDSPSPINLPANQVAITWDSSTDSNDLTVAHVSNPPILVSIAELNCSSARVPKQLSHKLFINIDYTQYNTPWQPEVEVGAEFEFSGSKHLLATLSQCGVWIKGQFNF